jgi:hypothetical protein
MMKAKVIIPARTIIPERKTNPRILSQWIHGANMMQRPIVYNAIATTGSRIKSRIGSFMIFDKAFTIATVTKIMLAHIVRLSVTAIDIDLYPDKI